jgi:hypothetical protein
LLISIVTILRGERPSRELRKVFVIVIELTEVTPAANVMLSRFGKFDHATVFTAVRKLNCKVERMVRLSSVKAPLIWLIVEDDKLVNPVTFWTMKSPPIIDGPFKSMSPSIADPTTMEPDILAQLAYCVASAWELIVAVAWLHIEAD